MHTRGTLRQEPEAKKVPRIGGSRSTTSTGKEEPWTSQLASEQRSLVKETHIDETPREETVEQPRSQREAGRRAAGKVAEAPTKPQGTVKDDKPKPGCRQRREPVIPFNAPDKTGRTDRKGAKGKPEELDPTRKEGKSEPEDNHTGTEGYQQERHNKDSEGQHEP